MPNHWATARAFGLIMCAVAPLLVIPGAAASVAAPPQRLVLDVVAVDYTEGSGLSADAYWRWTASPSENATTHYRLLEKVEGGVWSPRSQFDVGGVVIVAPQGRPDWRTYRTPGSTQGDGYEQLLFGDAANDTFRVQAMDDTTPGGASCVLVVHPEVGTYECGGGDLDSPRGAGAYTYQAQDTATGKSLLVAVRHANSSRAGLGNVSYEYQFRSGGTTLLPWFDAYPVSNATPSSGGREAIFNFSSVGTLRAGEKIPMLVRVRTYDTSTRERSAWSCVASASVGVVSVGGASCGGAVLPAQVAVVSGSETYPGVATAPYLGASPDAVRAVFGVFLVFTFALLGFVIGGALVAFIIGAMGVALALSMGWFPFWFIVVFVLACAAIVAARWWGGASSEA